MPCGAPSTSGRVLLYGATTQIEDVLADPEFDRKDSAQIGGWRTMLGTPLLRQGVPIGVLILARRMPNRFR